MILLLVHLYVFASASSFYAADQAPLDQEWTRFLSYRRSQSVWLDMYAGELGKCLDREMCLGPGERIYEVDTPPGFEVEAIVAFKGGDSQAGRLLIELPVELTGDSEHRTHLSVFTGVVDSLEILSSSRSVTLRKEK